MVTAKKNKYLPVLLDISEAKILLIGAGNACREKLRSLSQADVQVDVISPEFHEDFLNKDWLHLQKRQYQTGDLDGYSIVYVGINDAEMEEVIINDAEQLKKKQQILINFVDQKEKSDFISPSVLQKKNLGADQFIHTCCKRSQKTCCLDQKKFLCSYRITI